jgi:superfamily II DNA helicase RecQ
MVEDVTVPAHAILKLAAEVKEKSLMATRTMIIECLLGKLSRNSKGRGFEALAAFGLGTGVSKGNAERIHDHLMSENLLRTKHVQNGRYFTEYVEVRDAETARQLTP